MTGYTPKPETAKILNWCLETVNSVNYSVSLRWLFYRAMAPFGLTKDDYANRFVKWLSCARKSFYNGWRPDTLADDTREIDYVGGFGSASSWVKRLKEIPCNLAHWSTQPKVVLVCYEARAMAGQFKHYLSDYRVPLIPFGGDASIDLKWRIAELIKELSAYGKPIEVLYFGDLDKKGLTIQTSAFKDIKKWTDTPFTVTRIGLMPEHVKRFNIPENFEKPGEYQWEALNDTAAGELLEEVGSRLDLNALKDLIRRESDVDTKWDKLIDEVVDRRLLEEVQQ